MEACPCAVLPEPLTGDTAAVVGTSDDGKAADRPRSRPPASPQGQCCPPASPGPRGPLQATRRCRRGRLPCSTDGIVRQRKRLRGLSVETRATRSPRPVSPLRCQAHARRRPPPLQARGARRLPQRSPRSRKPPEDTKRGRPGGAAERAAPAPSPVTAAAAPLPADRRPPLPAGLELSPLSLLVRLPPPRPPSCWPVTSVPARPVGPLSQPGSHAVPRVAAPPPGTSFRPGARGRPAETQGRRQRLGPDPRHHQGPSGQAPRPEVTRVGGHGAGQS